MFTTCLVCHSAFDENDSLEHFPRGERVAFDPVKGRLWAICKGCKRWTLAPIEERWEALEELDKLVMDKARLLSQTDNIALLKAGKLEIVRIGRANLSEQAWWRYGRQLRERRKKHKQLTALAAGGVGAAVLFGPGIGLGWFGAWILWENAPRGVTNAARWLRFGSAAWRGERRCENCGFVFRSLPYNERGRVILQPGDSENGPMALTQPCPRCRKKASGGLVLTGREAEHAVRRVLAYHHFAGASESRIKSATRLIDEAGSADRLGRIVLGQGRRLGDLRRTGAIALEIAANESQEQRLLELELADLERHWLEEEELAEIIDGELTPLPVFESLRRKVIGGGG